ncbi:MAG TPA: S24/S26 family peptidase [Pseudonocardiaceae bacterium]|nr:S24/S26 family peptidase [Pseudonocardiaceae bacterium]
MRGPSMSPCLADGDIVLVRVGTAPRTGDVVLVRWATRPGQLSIKRAVRPEGPGTWFVTGDNTFGTTDSRQLGPAVVLGVARWRLWPRPGTLPQQCDSGL